MGEALGNTSGEALGDTLGEALMRLWVRYGCEDAGEALC
jgi:hypothetical protein